MDLLWLLSNKFIVGILVLIGTGVGFVFLFFSHEDDKKFQEKLQWIRKSRDRIQGKVDEQEEQKIYQDVNTNFWHKVLGYCQIRLGWGSGMMVERFIAIVGAGIFFLFFVIYFLGIDFIIALPLAIVLGALLAFFFLKRIEKKMVDEFALTFPDHVDSMARGVRSGLGMADQIRIVSQEADGVVGKVFRQIVAGMDLGMSLSQSLIDMNNKINVTDFNFFASAVIIQQQTGSSLHQILSNIAAMGRKRLDVRRKVASYVGQAKMGAYVIGALPIIMPLIISVANPNYYDGFFDDPLENNVLIFCLIAYGLGVLSLKYLMRERF